MSSYKLGGNLIRVSTKFETVPLGMRAEQCMLIWAGSRRVFYPSSNVVLNYTSLQYSSTAVLQYSARGRWAIKSGNGSGSSVDPLPPLHRRNAAVANHFNQLRNPTIAATTEGTRTFNYYICVAKEDMRSWQWTHNHTQKLVNIQQLSFINELYLGKYLHMSKQQTLKDSLLWT